jgi:hypothetical protein
MLHDMQRVASTVAVLLTLLAAAAFGQQSAGQRGGGLVPGGGGARTSLTREELIRSWDLDGDGTISKSESDLARARMRRQRIEMQLGGGTDPLTGLPRGGENEAGDADDEEPIFQLPPETEPAPPRRQSENPLPGMSAPTLAPPSLVTPSPTTHSSQPAGDLPQAGRAAPAPDGGTQRPAADTGSRPAAERSGRASWLPPRPLGPSTTGGLRAGAPAAVRGYDGRQRPDFNAGRLPADRQAPSPTGGGLVPAGRPPGRTGAIILPGQGRESSLPAGRGVPPPPPPPSYSPPRITAEEMGGYRP